MVFSSIKIETGLRRQVGHPINPRWVVAVFPAGILLFSYKRLYKDIFSGVLHIEIHF